MKNKKVRYYLNKSKGEFVIENYNLAKPFANFFPGIAGKTGIPMWAFYVNRAQCLSGFGTRDKDHAIMEYFPANKAWQLNSSLGFRTFIKISQGGKDILYEPFHNGSINLKFNLSNRMSITSCDLTLEEDNPSLGLNTRIEYFTIPQDAYAGLVRVLTLANTSGKTKKIQLLDGLPQIVPFGTSNLFLKKLGRTIEAWMQVENLENGAPFYRLSVDPTDRPEVVHIKEGNFYIGFHYLKNKPVIITPIVDPQSIFGPVTDFSYPAEFLAKKKLTQLKQNITNSRMPCAFLPLEISLAAKQEKSLYSVIGYMRSKEILNSYIPRIITAGYPEHKKEENKKIIQGLQQDIATTSSSRKFDLYAGQTYLDNIMRGGYPVIFPRPSIEASGGIPPSAGKSASSESVLYLYSRKHGDLERDYNKFQLQPTYFSQGNGNYRDANQNRRCDIWFNPEIKDANVITFFNLIQVDGFNPLVVKGISFALKDIAAFNKAAKAVIAENKISAIIPLISRPFSPGEIILFIQEKGIKLKCSYEEFLNILLSHCEKIQEAEHGEGFWTDHWTYNLDLLDSYLGLYPEKLKEIIFDKRVFSFYDNTETVKPRNEKYILKGGQARQLHCLYPNHTKREIIKKRTQHPHLVRTQYGKGPIYYTSLINKLLCLLANKLASLDAFGCGMEMEADKPNWYDALNGLPGLFGSSICETFELKRLILFLKDALAKVKIEKIYVTGEVRDFLISLGNLLVEYAADQSSSGGYQYWDRSYSLKEKYRNKTKLGFSGNEIEMDTGGLTGILDSALKKVDAGLNKALDKKKNIYCAYFINEVMEYETLGENFIRPLKFKQIEVPFFLEGQMHALRLTDNPDKARALHQAVKESELYDKKLKMYKVTAPLESMPEEIGRCRVFSPGWLENESIWLHMEYKYILELLKAGLYEEFYADFKNVLIPFQEPEKYGRSILENSSFLVSSAFCDKKLHGNGFVARLSGSTAEFLQIWLIMNIGTKPFFLNAKNELNLKFQPILAGWLFDANGKYKFNFLSKIEVIYHNPKRKDTFGKNACRIKKIAFRDKNDNPVELTCDTIPAPYAEQIRSRLVKAIDVYFS